MSSCQSFQTSPKKEEHSKRSESMMHGWKFEKTTGPKTTESTGNPSNGKKLYQMNCQKCHGNSGKGDGGVSRIMDTRLADLTKSDYQHKRHFFTSFLKEASTECQLGSLSYLQGRSQISSLI